MKKIVLIAAMALGLVVTAVAANPIEKKVGGQSRAIGLRGGYGVELSYQHTLGANFVETDLGIVANSINLAATYNWMIAQPQWTDRGEWGVYAGPGAAVGLGLNPAKVNIAVAGQIGLEYTFWFPLQLSLDLRPQIGLQLGGGSGFYAGGFYPALGVRYRF